MWCANIWVSQEYRLQSRTVGSWISISSALPHKGKQFFQRSCIKYTSIKRASENSLLHVLADNDHSQTLQLHSNLLWKHCNFINFPTYYWIWLPLAVTWSFGFVAQTVKNLSAIRKIWVHSWVWKIPWRRGWQPTPVSFPGELHGQWRLAGYSPCGCKGLDMTERLSLSLHFLILK